MPKKNITRSKRLHLVHRKHSGRRLHRSHTSYPLVAALLLMVGVLLSAMTLQAGALDVTVTGIVNGDPPTVPAEILSPVNDARFTDPSIPVSGTCQPWFFVKLYRNDIFSGSALCSPGGTFSLSTGLFPGRNDLVARTFNAAELEGPPSNTVTVYYDAPVSETPGGKPGEQPLFYLSTEYFFKAAYSGQKITWEFDIFGGEGPYTAYIVWGDGFSDVVSNISGSELTLEHVYDTLKERREYYTVSVRVQDARGSQTSLQLVAVMNDPDIIGASFAGPSKPTGGSLKWLWIAYVIVALMGVCFWLGERRGEAVTTSWYRKHPV